MRVPHIPSVAPVHCEQSVQRSTSPTSIVKSIFIVSSCNNNSKQIFHSFFLLLCVLATQQKENEKLITKQEKEEREVNRKYTKNQKMLLVSAVFCSAGSEIFALNFRARKG